MARKEHEGGILKNEDVEKELARQGGQPAGQVYRGMQDTGDSVVREQGTQVQQQDGIGEDTEASK